MHWLMYLWTESLVALSMALAVISLGGGLYEYLVVDPAWPHRPSLIQPSREGISRRRFWIPAHVAFELSLIASLIIAWGSSARSSLLVALASHAAMRIWSAFDFIPKALAFETADPSSVDVLSAKRWTRRSLSRLPLDVVTCAAMVVSLLAVVREA